MKAYDCGLNANACEDLAAMVETPQVGEIKFDIAFSPEWGVPEDIGGRPTATIGQARGLEVIREAAKGLRVINYEKQRLIVGKVRTLHSIGGHPGRVVHDLRPPGHHGGMGERGVWEAPGPRFARAGGVPPRDGGPQSRAVRFSVRRVRAPAVASG